MQEIIKELVEIEDKIKKYKPEEIMNEIDKYIEADTEYSFMLDILYDYLISY